MRSPSPFPCLELQKWAQCVANTYSLTCSDLLKMEMCGGLLQSALGSLGGKRHEGATWEGLVHSSTTVWVSSGAGDWGLR